MPGGDRTGPLGEGPMTGRGMGFCGGNAAGGVAEPGFRRGRGFGPRRGFAAGGRGGRGWRHRYWATGMPGWARADMLPTAPPDKPQWLEARAQALEGELATLRAQIAQTHRGSSEGGSGDKE